METQTTVATVRRALAAGVLAALLAGAGATALPAAAGGCGACDDDGDGLTNAEEYGTYGTDLALFDTDGDAVNDGLEISYGSDPLVPDYAPTDGGQNAPGHDDDGDGLGAYDEQTYGTDVTLFDTDGDGLSDGDEVHYFGTDPLVYQGFGRGPSGGDGDIDDDGLNDGDEWFVHGTDATRFDTDGDGESDGDEIHVFGTDPLAFDLGR